MIKLSPSEQRTPEYLSQGSLCRFKRCEALYALYAILGLRSTRIGPALEYGKAIHCAMPFLQRKDPTGALRAFTEVWSKAGVEDDPKRSIARAASLLDEWYAARTQPGYTSPYQIIEPPQTGVTPIEKRSEDEFAFLVDLEANLPFYGFLDGLAVSGSAHWIIEYKTTSELGQRFLNAFQLNIQIISYCTAVQILLPSVHVEGCYLEALRVSKTNAASQCVPVFVQEHEMESFISLYGKTVRQIEECLSSGEWEQNFSACTCFSQYGQPGYPCPYIDLCKSADWRSMLGAYRIEDTTPFTELKETPDARTD